MSVLKAALLALALPLWSAAPTLPVVAAVDLPRYMGAWHEISHMPNAAQRGCTDTMVDYRLNKYGGFDLANTCWKGGKYKPYYGVAKPATRGSTAKFRVKFFKIFAADYWIVALDPGYRWAAVGGPKRDQLWVISREASLDAAVYDAVVDRARTLGFDTGKLERTVNTGKASKGFEN